MRYTIGVKKWLALCAGMAALAALALLWPRPERASDPAPQDTALAAPERPAAEPATSEPAAPEPSPSMSAAPPATAASAAPPGDAPVPLEKLLGWKDAPARSALRAEPAPSTPAGGGRSSSPGGVRVDYGSEELGRSATGERSVARSEASVGVPVGDSVLLRGGAQQESDSGSETRTTPKLGVEVQF